MNKKLFVREILKEKDNIPPDTTGTICKTVLYSGIKSMAIKEQRKFSKKAWMFQ